MTIDWIRYFFVLISKWLTVFFDQFYHFIFKFDLFIQIIFEKKKKIIGFLVKKKQMIFNLYFYLKKK